MYAYSRSLYLDQLCAVLYDLLRPHIVHSNHMETLAELCYILRVEMIEEQVNNSRKTLQMFLFSKMQLFSLFLFDSRRTRLVLSSRFSIAVGRAGATRVPRPHLRAKRHPRLQARSRRFGVPGEAGNDGGSIQSMCATRIAISL